MLDRRIIVPIRRKPQNSQSQFNDDFYESALVDDDAFCEFDSLLMKRQVVGIETEFSKDQFQFKKCCSSCSAENKILEAAPGIGIFSERSPTQLQIIQEEIPKRLQDLSSNSKRKERKFLPPTPTVEFKSMVIGEVNYLEQLQCLNSQNKIRSQKRKHQYSTITKKIHKP